MFDNFKGAIFDLDGVIVDTAKYHYLTWKKLANELGFDFTTVDNEKLKGVSRTRSFEILAAIGGLKFNEKEAEVLTTKKNLWYVDYITHISQNELLPGAKEYISLLKQKGIAIALGSASKNAALILEQLKINPLFDIIVDGNMVSKAKPAPDVFLLGAASLKLEPCECVVFEDSEAGIEAAKRAGMRTVGIGEKELLHDADIVVKGLNELLENPA